MSAWSRPLSIAAALMAMAIAPTLASAASTRAEYVAQVDQVCAGFTPQFQKLAHSFQKKIRPAFEVKDSESDAQEKRRLNRGFRAVGRYVGQTARVFAAMAEQVALVVTAPGDEVAVAQWVEGLRQFSALQAQSVPAWKHRKLGRVAQLSDESIQALNNGGAAVSSFGISVCLTHLDVPETTYSDSGHTARFSAR